MDTPTSTTTSSPTASFTDSITSALSTLFPPKLSTRARTLSNATMASSNSVTPLPSPVPSSLHLSISSEEETKPPPILNFVVSYLEARDILRLSQATKGCRKHFCTTDTFQKHLMLNGWDTESLVRRSKTEMTKEPHSCPWMPLARSAIQKGDILRLYALLPKVDEKKGLLKDKKNSAVIKKLLGTLMDVATEHDQHNFSKLASLSNSLKLSFIQFMTAIPTYDWKGQYRKTFIVAAFTNSQPIFPGNENDLEGFSSTLTLIHPNPPLLLLAARANLLYTYACISYSKALPHPVQASCYDEPHATAGSVPLPGLRQGIERFTRRIAISGFYRKANGYTTQMRVAFEPIGLASKSRIPFAEKDLLTLNATVSDGDGHTPWDMCGSIDRNTGVGKLKTNSGMVYDLWATPWGLTGQKIRGEGKHLGYFVLHWV